MAVDLATLRERRLERAELVMRFRMVDGTVILVARDAATQEFVPIPVLAEDPTASPLALSRDGRRLLLNRFSPGRTYLVIHTFATRTNDVYASPPEQLDRCAVFAPDGTMLATLAHDDDSTVTLEVVRVSTRARHRLWSGDGGPSDLTWSPDGRHLAFTYVSANDDASVTVIITAEGVPVSQWHGMEIVNTSSSSWIDAHQLLLAYDYADVEAGDPTLAIVNAATGDLQPIVTTQHGGCLGAIAGRLIHRVYREGLITTNLDGTDPQPFLAVTPYAEIPFLDIAPGAGIADLG